MSGQMREKGNGSIESSSKDGATVKHGDEQTKRSNNQEDLLTDGDRTRNQDAPTLDRALPALRLLV